MAANHVRILFIRVPQKQLPVSNHLQKRRYLYKNIVGSIGMSLRAAPLPGVRIRCEVCPNGRNKYGVPLFPLFVSPYSSLSPLFLFPYSDLAVAYPHLDTNALTELLARAMFVAEAWGRISAQGEMG